MNNDPHHEWNGKLTVRGEHQEFFSLPNHVTDEERRDRELLGGRAAWEDTGD